ncbi:ExbD/TolR family protein [Pseudohalioglobus lutimaris]|uniref:Biopolymer transporter ExbD n=1 Tax=Pseudohalioglobus lutimaris TaxID=1737061 RepID=A0A2N5X0Q5_9GAMM|nr:biopolymer transporter ExbD [Pseudohalioglobus lutimaris]PLW68064.1 biopolymer transporter ExbD [Pseudohalioglobus lutimaris]
MRKFRRSRPEEAELDITAFMNLMIVLVPILLLGMVFSRITVVDVVLPEAAGGEPDQPPKQLELVIRAEGMRVDYPAGILLKAIPLNEDGDQDFALLSLVLQEVKRQLVEQGIEKRDITLLPEPQVDYQTIVSAMDTVRSFKALVAASMVDAALFPDISFGQAPEAEQEVVQ